MAIILAGANCDAQKSENPYKGLPFKERIFVGGDLGISFGSDITYIRVAPMLGYNVSPKFSVGAGPSYQYWEDRRFIPTLESTIWGASTFGRYFLLDQLFIQSEFEVLNLEEIAFTVGSDFDNRDRVTIPVLFVGGGYSQRTPSGAGFFASVMYDVIGDRNSPYPNDIVFRVGGFIGL
ncbi:MAG: hypothetical protein AAGC47_07905 [Bacteroidota bacterium]